jgi:hypothetical protein
MESLFTVLIRSHDSISIGPRGSGRKWGVHPMRRGTDSGNARQKDTTQDRRKEPESNKQPGQSPIANRQSQIVNGVSGNFARSQRGGDTAPRIGLGNTRFRYECYIGLGLHRPRMACEGREVG